MPCVILQGGGSTGGTQFKLRWVLVVLWLEKYIVSCCVRYLLAADDGDDQRHASRASRSSSDTSLRRDSMDSTFSTSEFDDSGTADNSTISTGDMSFSGADGQSSSEEQPGGDMSPFTVPAAAATKDPVRLKCREMLSAALKTPREFFTSRFCVECSTRILLHPD